MKNFIHLVTLIFLVLFSVFSMASNLEKTNGETQFNIYPNPVVSGEEIKVEFEMGLQKIAHIYVYDFAGKLVMESTDLRPGFGKTGIQEKILIEDKGLYLLKVVTEDEDRRFKQSKVKKLYVI